jgi:nucleolin
LVQTSAGKTKHLKSKNSSDEENNSSDEEMLKRKTKIVPSSKSKSRHLVSESSSEEPKKKAKDKKKLKKKQVSDSSEEVVIKKKKKVQESSEESSESDRHKKKKSKNQKKDKKKKPETSSSEDQKPKKKTKKFSSDSESESEPKPKKSKHKSKRPASSSSEEPLKKPLKSKESHSKPKTLSSDDNHLKPSKLPKKKISSSSEEEDPYKPSISKIPENQKKPILAPKPSKPETSSSPSSSSNSVHSSDDEEQNLVLTKTKKGKTNIKETLPLKRITPTPALEKPKPSEPQPPTVTSNDLELFIGGLAFEATEPDLRQLFSKFGEIDKISMPFRDGSPSGIAFVSFTSPASAQEALVLNNTEFMGRFLRISFSSGKKNRPAGQNSFQPSRQQAGSSSTVFVGNIPYTANEDMIQEFFGKCGDIKQVRLAKLPTGELKGFAHVEFYETDAAVKAVALAGTQIEGRAVKVEISAPKVQPGNNRTGDYGNRNVKPVNQSFAGQKIKL